MSILLSRLAAASAARDPILYYDILTSEGDRYGALAKGVVMSDTLSGRIARSFATYVGAATVGADGAPKPVVNITPETWIDISIRLMEADLVARSDAVNEGRQATDLRWDEVQDYHINVFRQFQLPPEAWTAFIPLATSSNPAATWEAFLSHSTSVSGFYNLIVESGSAALNNSFWSQFMVVAGADYAATLVDLDAVSDVRPYTYASGEIVIIGGGDRTNDVLVGTSGDNIIIGYRGNDILSGLAGNDRLYGGDGDDTLSGGAGNDQIDGGAGRLSPTNGSSIGSYGIDTASYATAAGSVRLDLGERDGFDIADGAFNVAEDGDGGRDRLRSIENIVLSQNVDTVLIARNLGLNGVMPTLIDGAGGNDRLSFQNLVTGFTLTGSISGDITTAGTNFRSFETVIGSTHSDSFDFASFSRAIRIESEGGSDRLVGSRFNDILMGGTDADTLIGGAGADILDGGEGVDTVDYSQSARGVSVLLRSGVGADFNPALESDARLDSYVSIENVIGTTSNDRIEGDENNNVLDGRQGVDRLAGYGGNDTLIGGDSLAANMLQHNDVAAFRGRWIDYRIDDLGGGSYRVADRRELTGANSDGIDTLIGVEFMDFNGNAGHAAGNGTIRSTLTLNRAPTRIDWVSGGSLAEGSYAEGQHIGSFIWSDPNIYDRVGAWSASGFASGTIAAANDLFQVAWDAGTGLMALQFARTVTLDFEQWSSRIANWNQWSNGAFGGVVPTASLAGTAYGASLTVTDWGGLSLTRSFAFQVTDVAEAPRFTPPTVDDGDGDASLRTVRLTENVTAVGSVAASDDEGQAIAYTLTGADAARFQIAVDGSLSFVAAPDFEQPLDADSDNRYEVTVRATAAGQTSEQAVRVVIGNVNETPLFADQHPLNLSLAENAATSLNLPQATDPDIADILRYALSGDDVAHFDVDPATGAITPKAPLNFEQPFDANGDNIYRLTLTATDLGGLTATRDVAVAVTDVDERWLLSTTNIRTDEDMPAALGTAIAFAPAPGAPTSGSLIIASNRAASFTLDEAPAGVSVQHGANQITLGGSSTGIASALAGLKLVSPVNSADDHVLTVTALPSGGEASTASAQVAVDAVADAPVFSTFGRPTYGEQWGWGPFIDATMAYNEWRTIPLTSFLQDTDGSESLSIAVDTWGGTAIFDSGDGILLWDNQDIHVRLNERYYGSTWVKFHAISTEAENGSQTVSTMNAILWIEPWTW
jgi:Ca2+-binding RTX toxin-like protein